MTRWIFPNSTLPPNPSLLCTLDVSPIFMGSKLFNRIHPSSSKLKIREGSCFEMPRMLTVAFVGDATTNMLTGKDHVSSLGAIENTSYNSRAMNEHMETRMEETMAAENLFKFEETELAATAKEALDLAQVAMRAAKDAAALADECENLEDILSEKDLVRLERARLTERERFQIMKALDHSRSLAVGESSNSDVACPSNFPSFKKKHTDKVAMNLQERMIKRTSRVKARKKANKVASAIASTKQPCKSKNPVSSLVDFSDPLHVLKDSSNSKLLTAREEVELAKGIQELLKLEKIRECLAMQIGQEPNLNKWSEAAGIDQKTLQIRLFRGQQCRSIMFNRNLGLIRYVAKKYRCEGLSFQDLVQAGYAGLVRGVEKFDYTKGFRFSTYAYWWIRQAITRAIAQDGRLIRVPQNVLNLLSRIKKIKLQWYQEHGRHPSSEEISKLTGLSVTKLKLLMLRTQPPRSLHQNLGQYENLTFADIIADQCDCSAEKAITKRQLRKDINKVLNRLSKPEKEIMRLRHGLDDGRRKSLTEIGELFGFSREWIRRIEINALRKIREDDRVDVLRYYLEC